MSEPFSYASLALGKKEPGDNAVFQKSLKASSWFTGELHFGLYFILLVLLPPH